MNFNISETAGLGEISTSRQLEGNKIHTVKFDGCEATDLKDGQYHTLQIKFSNDEGSFTHTIFEPREQDMVDGQSVYGPTPSMMKNLTTTLRHLGAAVSPGLTQFLNNPLPDMSWDLFRKKVVEASKDGIGKETKIKLLARETTDANGLKQTRVEFPRYVVGYRRDGGLFMRTNFIGDNVYFTKKELEDIQKVANAKPTNSDDFTFTAPAAKDDKDFDDEI